MARKKVFDPKVNLVVTQCETTSVRVENKLRDPYNWHFCDFCYVTTEYSLALESQSVYKHGPNQTAKPVVFSNEMRTEAQAMAGALVARYKRALKEHSKVIAEALLLTYCDVIEMRGNFSIEAFEEQVNDFTINYVWKQHGQMLSVLQLPGQKEGEAKPSKFYCSNHNPRRSEQARRNYQKDKRFLNEFEDLVDEAWSIHAGILPSWDVLVHKEIRRYAFQFIQLSKKTIFFIDYYDAKGYPDSKIAQILSMTRQAISMARKRYALQHVSERQQQVDNLILLAKKLFIPIS